MNNNFPEILDYKSKYATALITKELSLASIPQAIRLTDTKVETTYYKIKNVEVYGIIFLFTLYRLKDYYLCITNKYNDGNSLTIFYEDLELDFIKNNKPIHISDFMNIQEMYPGKYPGKSGYEIFNQDTLNKFAKYIKDNENYYRLKLL